MKKLILCFALIFTVGVVAAQTDTSKIKPDDITVLRINQVDVLLRKIQRLEEDLVELRNMVVNFATGGLVKNNVPSGGSTISGVNGVPKQEPKKKKE